MMNAQLLVLKGNRGAFSATSYLSPGLQGEGKSCIYQLSLIDMGVNLCVVVATVKIGFLLYFKEISHMLLSLCKRKY